MVRAGIKLGGKKGGRGRAIAKGREAQAKASNPKDAGKGEKIGAVVGGIAGGLAGGVLDVINQEMFDKKKKKDVNEESTYKSRDAQNLFINIFIKIFLRKTHLVMLMKLLSMISMTLRRRSLPKQIKR